MNAATPAQPVTHPLEDFLGYQLRRATAAMQADLNTRIAELGVTIVEMSTLLVIERNPLVTQSEIGRMLAIKSANMAPLAGGLFSRGLIERLPVDGRSQGLRLTEAGQALVSALHQRIDENEALIMAKIPESERAGLKRMLRQVWSGRD